EIQRIYFVKKATGKGLGKAVMRRIEFYAQKLHKKVLWLKVMDSSSAITFYEKCGYTAVGETKLDVDGVYPKFQRQLIMQKIL
ncbi:MAG: GNAT family N-acetyltransferase, partial [Bacteroidota bacterium]